MRLTMRKLSSWMSRSARALGCVAVWGVGKARKSLNQRATLASRLDDGKERWDDALLPVLQRDLEVKRLCALLEAHAEVGMFARSGIDDAEDKVPRAVEDGLYCFPRLVVWALRECLACCQSIVG